MAKKFQDLSEQAAKYRELSLQIKELEQLASPLKIQLLQYAASIDQPSLNIGEITVEKRITKKVIFDEDKLTPDWLYRFGENGGRCFLKIGIDRKVYGNIACGELVEELGGVITKTPTFAIRI